MPRAMKLIDETTGMMECTICGSVHVANLRPSSEGGGFYRGSWQCSNEACPTKQKSPAKPGRVWAV